MFKWGRDLVQYFADDLKYLSAHPLNVLINAFDTVRDSFLKVWRLITGKKLVVHQQVITDQVGAGASFDGGNIGGITNYSGSFDMKPHKIHSTMDINVFDPHKYIKNISTRSDADIFNMDLGNNMSYSS